MRPGTEFSGLNDPLEARPDTAALAEVEGEERVSVSLPVSARPATARSLEAWLRDHISTVLIAVWLVPVLGLAAGAVIVQRRTGRVLQSARPVPLAARHLLLATAHDFGYGRSIRFCVSSDVESPRVAGIFRPVIVVPERMLAIGETDLRGILAHELAHLTSRDLLWSQLIQMLSIGFWFHPLVWGIRREHLDACEQVSDAEAARYVGDVAAYSGTLARAALGVLGRRCALAGIPMVRKPRIRVRLEMLRQKIDTSPLRRRRVALVLTAGCLLLVGLGGLKLVDARGMQPRGEPAAAAEPSTAAEEMETTVIGQVLDPNGNPASGSSVAVIARSRQPHRGGDLESSNPKPLVETKTDGQGRFRVRVPRIVPAMFRSADVVAIKSGYGVGFEPLALEAEQHDAVIRLTEEQDLRGRVVDEQNRPAVGARVYVTWLARTRRAAEEGVGPHFSLKQFPAWPKAVTTDGRGRFAIRGINRSYTTKLNVSDRRFAKWDFFIKPPGERPPKKDPKYEERTRNLAKASENVYCEDPAEELTLSPPPAQILQGRVVHGDTHQPAAHARLTAYASRMEHGSAVGVPGRADADGRFRLNPYPGKFFHVTAYPATGQPYLILKKTVAWPEKATSYEVDMALPRGVLVRGKITEQPSGGPVEGAAVQYHARDKNPHVPSDAVTGWQGMVISDADGTFQITVPAGKGTLLVHGPTPEYVQQIIGSNQLHYGRSGGTRQYVHASIPLDLQPGAAACDVTASLQRGITVRGRLVGPPNKVVDEALMLACLYRSATSPEYRARPVTIREGRFELPGCDPEKSTSVYFLDPKNELGAVVEVSGQIRQPLQVRFAPCGTATARFVDTQGKPLVEHRPGLKIVMTPGAGTFRRPPGLEDGELLADEDFVANFDRLHYWDGPRIRTDGQGRCRFPALIPGATYRLDVFDKATSKWMTKDFSVKSGETVRLPEMTLDL